MKRRDVLIALSGLAAITADALYPTAAYARELSPIELPSSFQYPNGIARTQDGTLYVGSVTNGRILQIFPNGRIETLFPGNSDIFAVTSLRLDEAREILWGASPDVLGTPQSNGEIVRRPGRIFALDTRSKKVLQIIIMPDGGFGNDLALDRNGGVYVTDSSRPRIHYLPPGATQFQTWAEDERFHTQLRFGLSGIVRRPDGVLFVTMYSDGRLFKVTPRTVENPVIEEITLPRKIDGSDAIQLASDGSLIMLEAGIESGNGRVLQLRPLEAGAKSQFNVLASRMDLPVNLTVAGQEVWVTESLFRHRLVPGQQKKIPNRFFVRRFMLP
ncbi:gluconolaconase [Nostoc sp. FACHB-892]|uniref:gluconolaconase n=1 Tax=Nostoc sp. FACHB-892 TaxID=2692843 RepID=UPI0016828193|nr:gluconolaconase [Nostoc sp. FACHB-892]MBD2731784.1 gluconolaconase [Nostoc sp. FACHB-892]